MKNKALVITASPKGKKGNSVSLADYLLEELKKNNVSCEKVILCNEMTNMETLVQAIDQSQLIVLSFPVYQNGVPGLVVEFFELVYAKKDKLGPMDRKLMVISNCGFPEPETNNCAIAQCKQFADALQFNWAGGISVAPGTLIDGKELHNTGNTYKQIRRVMTLIAEKIGRGEPMASKDCEMSSKPLMAPFVYRTAGRLIQYGNVKKLGKTKFYATPF